MLLRRLFANHNNISKRIIPICTNQFYTDYAIVVKHKSSITSNLSICSNHFTTYLKKKNNVTLSNFKSFSTSEINIVSEIDHVNAQLDNVGIKD
jgi:hypothetical protein